MEIIRRLPAHSLLPSETELVRKYGVSRGTVKQALDQLEHQSFIYRKHGKGTFVAEPRILRHSRTVPSFSEDIRRRGHTPSIRLVSLTQEEPGPGSARRFPSNRRTRCGKCRESSCPTACRLRW